MVVIILQLLVLVVAVVAVLIIEVVTAVVLLVDGILDLDLLVIKSVVMGKPRVVMAAVEAAAVLVLVQLVQQVVLLGRIIHMVVEVVVVEQVHIIPLKQTLLVVLVGEIMEMVGLV